MLSALLALAIIAALVSVGLRRLRRTRLRRAARTRAGSSAETAIVVRSFTDMDDQLAARWCACGGYLERLGEGSRAIGERRYRIARLRCQECEELDEVFFDTTDLIH